MIRQCSWCKKILGEKEPLEDKRTTHTICDDCYEEVEKEEKERISNDLKQIGC